MLQITGVILFFAGLALIASQRQISLEAGALVIIGLVLIATAALTRKPTSDFRRFEDHHRHPRP